MKKYLTAIIFLFSLESDAQYFEGVVRFDIFYTSNADFPTAEQMKEYGTIFAYNIKGGNYRFDFIDGKQMEWLIYLDSTKKLYTKLYNNDTVYWKFTNITRDSILETTINKKALDISGVWCDEIIFKTSNGLHKYYYNPAIKIDTRYFTQHKHGNLAEFLAISGSIPIIEIIEDKISSIKSEAVEIIQTTPPPHLFKLPPNVILVPSPY